MGKNQNSKKGCVAQTYMFWGVDGGGSISWQPSSGTDFIATPFSPSDGKDSPKDAEAEWNLAKVEV